MIKILKVLLLILLCVFVAIYSDLLVKSSTQNTAIDYLLVENLLLKNKIQLLEYKLKHK